MDSIKYEDIYEDIFSKESLDSMIIDNDITFKEIYSKLFEKDFEVDILSINGKNITIEKEKDDIDFFNVKLNDECKLQHLFQKPFKLDFEINGTKRKIDIISILHFLFICEKYNIKNPVINCLTCKKTEEIYYDRLKIHYNHEVSVKESLDITIISKTDFDQFFIRDKNCFGNTSRVRFTGWSKISTHLTFFNIP